MRFAGSASRRCRRALLAVCLSVLTIPALAERGQAGACDQPAQFYEQQGYTVRSVRISTGLSWLPAVQRTLEPIQAMLPLKPRQVGSDGSVVSTGAFMTAAYFEGQDVINHSFPEVRVNPQVRFAVRFSRPFLQNCNTEDKTLDVVYGVYTVGLPTFNAFVFEAKPQGIGSAVPQNRTTSFLSRFQVQPELGYNGTRKTFGGTAVTARFNNSILQNASGEIAGSSQSLTAVAQLSGSHDNLESPIAHLDWKLQYLHKDVPLAQSSTSQNVLSGQFLFGTAPVTASELIFRFGGVLEGGNQQTNLPVSQLTTTDVASSSYGAAKAFVGSSFRLGRHTFKQSYGIKFGGTGAQFDFTKQVVDIAQRMRFYPASHRELTIDASATLGRLDIFGQLPASERFFGGNVEENFAANDNWVIRGNPFMRSFAQNQFVLRGPSGQLVGDRFFSANATVAFNIWRYPLIPAEVENDPEFRSQINTVLGGSEDILINEYIADTSEFRGLAQQLPGLSGLASKVREQLKSVPPSSQSVSDALDAANQAATGLDNAVSKAIQDNKAENLSVSDIQKLTGIEPEEAGAPPDFSYLLDLASAIDDLKSAVADSENAGPADGLASLAQQLRDAHSGLYRDYIAAMQSPAAKKAQGHAKSDMTYSRRVVSEVFDTANLVAVSPVAMFDTGQIWQSSGGGTGVRYGAGTGVKLTVFAIDFTAGYSWNIHRRPGEGGGAFVLNLAVGDLFK